jgi:hypothetical protein
VADFNSDGRLDIAVANGDGNSISVLLGNGGGTFGTKLDFGVGRFPTDVLTADLNGDGRPDLVSCDSRSGTLTLLENRGTAPPNRAPTAVPGGPYTGVVDVPVQLHGSQSSDPEGSPLSFRWSFGDGVQGTGSEPTHTYRSEGRFTVVLTVSDGTLEGRDSTTTEIAAAFTARVFPSDGRHPVIVGNGALFTYVEMEPIAGAYDNADVMLSSLRLLSPGTGVVSEIGASAGKRALVIDKDGNGIFEISVAFAREDLTRLSVVLEARLTTGVRVRGPFEIAVVGPGGTAFSVVSSNPIRSGGTLTLFQPRPGPLRVEVFDSAGRLVRILADERAAAQGFLDLRIDGQSEAGAKLPSGIYFYKVTTAEGNATGRIVILR